MIFFIRISVRLLSVSVASLELEVNEGLHIGAHGLV